jgi:hypothetical protein
MCTWELSLVVQRGAGCATARGMSWEVRYMVGSWDGGGIVESCNHGIIIIIIMAMFLVV